MSYLYFKKTFIFITIFRYFHYLHYGHRMLTYVLLSKITGKMLVLQQFLNQERFYRKVKIIVLFSEKVTNQYSANGISKIIVFSVKNVNIKYQKYLNLCSEDEQSSYRFGTTGGGIINDRIFIFGWNIPLIVNRPMHAKKMTFRMLQKSKLRWTNIVEPPQRKITYL